MIFQHLHESGLPNTGFTRYEHDLPMSYLRLLPPFQEERDFGCSTDERCESPGLRHLQATGGPTLTEDLIHTHGLGDAAQGVCSQVLALKIPLHQAICRVTDGHGIGRRQSLYPGGNVRRFPECQLLLTPCATHGPNDHEPGMDAKTDSKLETLRVLQAGIAVSHRREDAKTSSYGSLGIIFVCPGITKVHQQSIPEQLGDMSIVALDDVRTSRLIGTHDIPVLFGIEVGRECGGVHEVTKHHGQLAAFRLWRRGGGWRRGRHGGGCGRGDRRRRVPRPDEDRALLIHRQALARDEFELQVLERLVIELELQLEGPIGQAAPLAQKGDRLIDDRDKVHPVSSLPEALSQDACATPSYHKRQGGR